MNFSIISKIPPPVFFFLGLVLMKITPLYFSFNSNYILAFLFLFLSGIFALMSVATFLFKGKSSIHTWKTNDVDELYTQGIYRFSRNPMYFSLVLALIAWFFYLGNPASLWVVISFVWIVTHFQIKAEEQSLKKLFGEQYLQYQKKVRRWI